MVNQWTPRYLPINLVKRLNNELLSDIINHILRCHRVTSVNIPSPSPSVRFCANTFQNEINLRD